MSELDLIFSIVLPFAEIGFIFIIFGLVNIDSSVSSIFSLDLVVDHFLLMNIWLILIHAFLKVLSLIQFREISSGFVYVFISLHEL